jgi:hypothetical protein
MKVQNTCIAASILLGKPTSGGTSITMVDFVAGNLWLRGVQG